MIGALSLVEVVLMMFENVKKFLSQTQCIIGYCAQYTEENCKKEIKKCKYQVQRTKFYWTFVIVILNFLENGCEFIIRKSLIYFWCKLWQENVQNMSSINHIFQNSSTTVQEKLKPAFNQMGDLIRHTVFVDCRWIWTWTNICGAGWRNICGAGWSNICGAGRGNMFQRQK